MAKLVWTSESRGSECEWTFALHSVMQKFFVFGIVECSCVIDTVLVKETVIGGQIVGRR